MKSPLAALLIFGSCLLSFACQPTASEPAEPVIDEQAVRDTLAALANEFSLAYMAGDAAAMTALYTDDAVIFPGNAEFIQGHDPIEQYWTLPEGRRITHHQITPVEVEISGSMASDFGHYEVSGENDGEPWGPAYGKYVIVWKRGDDGRWRMHLDMWNSRPGPPD